MGQKRTKRYKTKAHDLMPNSAPQWLQSSSINTTIYTSIRNEMLNIAMSRFKWLNLPKTCNARFLEQILLFDGVATIAFPKSQKGIFYSTQANVEGKWNVYYNPTKWRSYGLNNWSFFVDNSNGVIMYENQNRTSILPIIDFYANEIADIYMAKRQNRFNQKIPFILQTRPEQELAATNLIKQIGGGEMAILATDSFGDSMKATTLNTNVSYLGAQFNEEINNTWQQFYQSLGIASLPFKTERQTADEIQDISEPTDFRALSELMARREAIDTLNNRFKRYLEKPIEVVWNTDNISDNYNYLNDIDNLIGDDNNGN